MFPFCVSPLADNAHRGISPLAFVLMSVAEENQLREDQESYDGATSLTPGMVRAAKRKCLSIPTTLRELVELLRCYISAGHFLFTARCEHFVEVVRIRQELILMFRRNRGMLSAKNVATLLWDITADAAQYFYTFPSSAQFAIVPPEGMPTSNLLVRRSLLSANIHISSVDKPQRWLALPPPLLPPMNVLGLTRAQQQTVDKARQVMTAADSGDGGGGR